MSAASLVKFALAIGFVAVTLFMLVSPGLGRPIVKKLESDADDGGAKSMEIAIGVVGKTLAPTLKAIPPTLTSGSRKTQVPSPPVDTGNTDTAPSTSSPLTISSSIFKYSVIPPTALNSSLISELLAVQPGGAIDPCFPIAEIDADRFVNCLRSNFQREARSAKEVVDSLLKRPNAVADRWRKEGGCQAKHFKLALERSKKTAVLLFVSPPKVEILHSPPGSDVDFYIHQLARVVASPAMTGMWKRFTTSSKRWKTREAQGNSSFGFPLVLHFGDFADEETCVFGAYALSGPDAKSFTVWDPYVDPSTEIPIPSYRNTRFGKYAPAVLGKDGEWKRHDWLSENETALKSFVEEALGRLPPWQERKPELYFRGSPTHRLRRFVGLSGEHFNIRVKKFYGGNMKKVTFESFEDCYKSKMVLALRGMNAALRDRQLLLSGSALVRIMDIDKEPLQMPHDMLHPFVHYIPLVYRGPVGKTKAKQGPKQLLHLTGTGLNSAVATLLKDFGSKSFDVGSAGKLTVPPESILHAMGQNNLRVAAMIASEQFRDEVMRRVLWMYIAYALNPTM